MVSWLCILDRKNFEIVRKRQVWGVSKRHRSTIAKVNPSDSCLFYLIAEGKEETRKVPAIGGITGVASKPYEDISDIFPSKRDPSEVYPYRIKLEKVRVFEPYVPFKPLIPQLSFIKNKKNYTGYIMGRAMREIPEGDVKLIIKMHQMLSKIPSK